uniref:Helicase C-terminal domain-containing protein n=1 Tax=Parastrongyloides trichosuri TaxID=131310 RepID=A0A0N4ZFP5_PARTI
MNRYEGKALNKATPKILRLSVRKNRKVDRPSVLPTPVLMDTSSESDYSFEVVRFHNAHNERSVNKRSIESSDEESTVSSSEDGVDKSHITLADGTPVSTAIQALKEKQNINGNNGKVKSKGTDDMKKRLKASNKGRKQFRDGLKKQIPDPLDSDSDSDNSSDLLKIRRNSDKFVKMLNGTQENVVSSNDDIDYDEQSDDVKEFREVKNLVNEDQPSKYNKSEEEFVDEMETMGHEIKMTESTVDVLISTKRVKRLIGGSMTEGRFDNLQQGLFNLFKTVARFNMSYDSKDVIETPSNFNGNLYNYQMEGLNFLVSRENTYPCGGILADDMGLGKTPQIIALIIHQKENLEASHLLNNIVERKAIQNGLKTVKSTLIICPAGLMNQWEREIKNFAQNDYLTVYLFHGPKRKSDPKVLGKYDVIISSYATIASELSYMDEDDSEEDGYKNPPTMRGRKKKTKNIMKSDFGSICFRRIVLDEAHEIKNRNSKASRAISRISGLCRWCLTGTPIHNEMMDAFSLYRFLRCYPIDQEAVWKQYMNTGTVDGPLRMKCLVKATLLRRTKNQKREDTGEVLINLPERSIKMIELDMEHEERSIYDQMFTAAQQYVKCFLDDKQGYGRIHKRFSESLDAKYLFVSERSDASKNNFERMTYILILLLRLRQACNHFNLTKNGLDLDCLDAVDEKDVVARTEIQSLNQSIENSIMDDFGGQDYLKIFEEKYHSCKIKALFKCLDKIFEESDDKVIIISQWTSMLRLLHSHLNERGIDFVEITGEIQQKNRQAAQQDINDRNGGKRVMLLSLKAGGVGLNLVGANHIFMLDLHWNPFNEDQACDRIYRIGQTKNVFIHKFVCKDTIEKRVMELQEKKRALSDEFFGTSNVKKANNLNDEDLAYLFNC